MTFNIELVTETTSLTKLQTGDRFSMSGTSCIKTERGFVDLDSGITEADKDHIGFPVVRDKPPYAVATDLKPFDVFTAEYQSAISGNDCLWLVLPDDVTDRHPSRRVLCLGGSMQGRVAEARYVTDCQYIGAVSVEWNML